MKIVALMCAGIAALAGCSGSAQNPGTVPPAKAAPMMEAPKPPPVMEAPRPAAKPANPDLLVHLKFEDGGADASGKGHAGVVQGKVSWGEGKSGKAAVFDGSGGHLELPSSPDLDKVNEGNYTLAAWFKPADVPPGKEDHDNTSNYGILNKTGWHEGLRYGKDKKFVFEHWLAGDKPEEPKWKGAGTWEAEYEPGQWYHLAGVVDRSAGAVKIYVNGELVNTNDEDFPANAKAREYGATTWKIGTAAPGSDQWSWPAKGAIADVRIYKKALSDAEVQAIFKEGSK